MGARRDAAVCKSSKSLCSATRRRALRRRGAARAVLMMNESEQRPPALFGSRALPTTRPPWLPLPQTGKPGRRVRTDCLECSLLLNLFCIGRGGSRAPAGSRSESRSDAEVEPPAHRVVHSAAPPPPPQWRVEPVGSLEPMQRLQDFERHLRLPPEAEGHALLEHLEQNLRHAATKLQLPVMTDGERTDVMDAQLVGTLEYLSVQVLRCDGVSVPHVRCDGFIVNVPVARKDFARLRHPGDASVISNDELYLSDDLVDAWAHCLRLTRPAEGGGVYQWLTAAVRKYDDLRWGQPAAVNDVMRHVLGLKRLGLDLLQQRAWVLPRVCDRHWTSVVVDFRAKLVLSVDPLGSELPDFVARACTIMDVVSRVLAETPFDFTGWTRGSLGLSSPMQPDCFNCGIFPLLLSRCLHHDVKISRWWTSKDLDEHRDLIVLELIEGRLLSFV